VEKRGYPVTRQVVAYPFHAAPNAALASPRLSATPAVRDPVRSRFISSYSSTAFTCFASSSGVE